MAGDGHLSKESSNANYFDQPQPNTCEFSPEQWDLIDTYLEDNYFYISEGKFTDLTSADPNCAEFGDKEWRGP